MAIEITSKIVGYRIKQQGQPAPEPVLAEEDPLTVRIPSRPEGTLEAVSEKISYVGAEGRKKVYLLVSFMPVEGVVGGQRVVIERSSFPRASSPASTSGSLPRCVACR